MKKRGISFICFSVLLSALVCLSGFIIWRELSDRQKEKDTFDSLAELVQTEPSESTALPKENTEPADEPEAEPVHRRNLSALTGENSDCVGWLCIPGTAVNYPVMHTPDDPQKYLRRDFYGSYSESGVPFLDGRCGLSSTNLIIYGHNMKNGTMFSDLRKYLDTTFRAGHPVIELETVGGCSYYTVTLVKIVDRSDEWYAYGIYKVFEDERYLTLSTCYGSDKDSRLLVVAVKQQHCNFFAASASSIDKRG